MLLIHNDVATVNNDTMVDVNLCLEGGSCDVWYEGQGLLPERDATRQTTATA